MLITFEGGEGAGKSTLIRQVMAFLQKEGQQVVETREPGGTALGTRVRDLLLKVDPEIRISAKAELMLYMTSRAQTIEEIIAPAVKAGSVVLCDRFNDSTIVYQGCARGLGMEAVKGICDFVCGSVRPDLTLYLDVDPELGLQRTRRAAKEQSVAGEVDRIEAEALTFHIKVREAYLRIAQEEPQRVVVLDASRTVDQVWVDARRILEARLPLLLKNTKSPT